MNIQVLFTSHKRYGGTIYQEYLVDALNQNHSVDPVNIGITEKGISKIFGFIKYIHRMYTESKKTNYDIAIKPMQAVFHLQKKPVKTIIVVHHIDTSFSPIFSKIYQDMIFRSLFKKKLKIDRIIVVSKYWKQYLEKLGFSKISIVYNYLNNKDFQISQQKKNDFKQKYFPDDKPIFYLGNPLKKKGFDIAFNAIKHLDAYFVVTGNGSVEEKRIKHLKLDYSDFLVLLSISNVVITMSLFNEGWCRVAHEAMMCGTPVIGSGFGGMKELLEGGKQICLDPSNINKLPEEIDQVMSNYDTFSKNAKYFAELFNRERFISELSTVIEKI